MGAFCWPVLCHNPTTSTPGNRTMAIVLSFLEFLLALLGGLPDRLVHAPMTTLLILAPALEGLACPVGPG